MANPIRVLVVDDSVFMRNALSRNIESDRRFKVIDTAFNGHDGVEKAIRLKPDVVTLDVEMPVMNGIDALKAIVSKTSIPVIMVSAVTENGARTTMEALEIGAVDFIPKAKGAELIHEKLLAAVSANLARAPQAGRGPIRVASPSAAARSAPLTLQFKPKIIVVGSSTGGPQALQDVIKQLPANLPVPVVVAQHMPPQFTLALAKRLDATCPPKVVEATDGAPLTPGTVYIGPGGMHLRVTQTNLKVEQDKGESLYKPSVDVLAESVLATFGKNVLGVMLTGMGNDGMREFVKLRKNGAYIIVQDSASCVVYGMPKAVADAGCANDILPVDKIGPRIREALRI
ncbi:MAG: chemotaxis response regulator protein-glutamate methylesterase [Rhodomicrobium sp.]|nr:chemotaxis response regulator protein-glutamate methylesterase [Rhodomicrobium sp.]